MRSIPAVALGTLAVISLACGGRTPLSPGLRDGGPVDVLVFDAVPDDLQLAACELLEASTCASRPDCQVLSCQLCNGPVQFVGCMVAGAGISGCPPIPCPPPLSCASYVDEASCRASGACHAVYTEDRRCNSADCRSHFWMCADGRQADCTGPAMCHQRPPACVDAFAVSYAGGCYEGCVLNIDCR